MESLAQILKQRRASTNHQKHIEEPVVDKRKRLLGDLCLPDPPPTFREFKKMLGTEKALRAYVKMAKGEAPPLLLCYGDNGNGKTHLMQALVLAFHRHKIFARYMTWSKIIRTFRNAQKDGAMPNYYEILEQYCEAKGPLVIDDVGLGTTGTVREWGDLEEIVNSRYNARLVTVLATNLVLDELPVRVVSRFRDPDVGVIVWNEGKDYRRLKSEMPDK